MIAACKNDMKMVAFLLKNKANPSLKNSFDQTAADMAGLFGHYDVASYIQAHIDRKNQ